MKAELGARGWTRSVTSIVDRIERLPRSARVGGAVVAGAAAAALVVALGPFWTFVATLAIVYALLGVSLAVLTGWSGQLNLHVAALGLGWGAYASFALSSAGVAPILALLGAAFLTVPFSVLVGSVAVRFRGLELAVATLAIGLTFERLAFKNIARALARASRSATPFQSSFVPVSRPRVGGMSFVSDTRFYLLSLAVAVAVVLVVTSLGRRSTGRTLRAIREREVVAEVLGVPTLRYRIGAFTLSIAIAATAGALFAALKQSIVPDSFSLDLSFPLLTAVVIGGIRSVWGGMIGGALAAVLPELVRSGPLSVFGGERLFLLFAAGMILTLLFLPQGLVSLGKRLRPDEEPGREDEPDFRPPVSTAATGLAYASDVDRTRGRSVLRADGLRVSFGGVQALDGADLWIPEREICALIGPNGAGKSTMFNCLSGLVTPDEGRVYLDGADVTDMPAHRRAALGMGRTFQSVELFRELTVLENLMVGGHRLRRAGPFAEGLGLPASAHSERDLKDRAREVLRDLGMEGYADVTPARLSFGHLRLVEIGAALMLSPRILLLDEPSAGLNPADSEILAGFIAHLRDERALAVLLVEHDMAVVGAISDWVYVLDFGTVIAAGTPAAIRRDPTVIARYLGESAEDLIADRGAEGAHALRA